MYLHIYVSIYPSVYIYMPMPFAGTPPTCSHTLSHTLRCRANSAQMRQSRLDSGLGIQVKVLKPFWMFSLRSAAVSGKPFAGTATTCSNTSPTFFFFFFFFFNTLMPRVEWYKSLCALNTSPPRNHSHCGEQQRSPVMHPASNPAVYRIRARLS